MAITEDASRKIIQEIRQRELERCIATPRKACWSVPLTRNDRFVGRSSQLSELQAKLFVEGCCPRATITGLGGIGKTQIALELAYRTRDSRPDCSVFWVPATSVENVQQAYLEIGRKLHIPGLEEKKEDAKKLVQDYLSQEGAGQWLLIVDNADDINIGTRPACLIDYLPKSSKGSIVITTRSWKVAVKFAPRSVIQVPEIDEDVAAQILRNSLRNQEILNDRRTMIEFLSQLTFLPLAIVQAAAYINKNDISLPEYLLLWNDTEENIIKVLSDDFEDGGRYQDLMNPVTATWLISFEQIRSRDPLAAEYLSFMSCLDPKMIPESLLPPAQTKKRALDGIGTLTAYSFLTKRPENQFFDLHRLVHLATRNWLREQGSLGEWTKKAIVQLVDTFPDHDHRNRTVWRAYQAHAHHVLASNLVDKGIKERLLLLQRFGLSLRSDGRYIEAEETFAELIDMSLRMLGQDHPDTLTSMANLASTYWNQGRWKEAEELEVQVMETNSRVLGQEHLDTLTSMNNLVVTYWKQGRWKEAEELGVQVMETRKRVLGQEHPDTLTSMNNLASTYRKQGQWKEAEELGVQVMETSSRVLGAEHPATLTSIGNLMLTFLHQGRWKEAEELGLQLVETNSRVLGQEHPDTLTSMANLAAAFSNQGRWKEAEELEVQVMETSSRMLGKEHLDTLTSMASLASMYRKQRRWKEAEELEHRFRRISKAVTVTKMRISTERTASSNLCPFCSSLNYAGLGFSVDSSEEDISPSKNQSALIDGKNIVIREMVDVLPTSQHCSICWQFVEIVEEYKSSKPPNDIWIDWEKLEATIMFSSIQAPFPIDERGQKGACVRLLLTVDKKRELWDIIHTVKDESWGERTFQRCHNQPMDINDFCRLDSLTDWNISGVHPFEGRIRPLVANTQLFLKWAETCRMRHGSRCRSNAVDIGSVALRFIDVERRNVIDGQPGAKYFALSYIWGSGGNPCKLTRLTAPLLYQPGQLTPDVLPATISDAILVTAALGGKYLWADCLCIFQDDEAEKAEILPRMHLIFTNAEVTIVAAAGDDCHAGLPGIRSNTRNNLQYIISLGKVSIMQSLDPGSDPEKGGLYLGNTVYNTRGWCFQERLLSYRALIFAPEQVYWECQNATWCEESFWESPNFPALYRHSLGSNMQYRLPLGSHQAGSNFIDLFRCLVDTYSSFNLSFESDQLNAFLGILRALETGFNESFFWAMPLSFLESALSWSDAPGMRRNNTAHILKQNGGNIIAVPFPSWSWIGWIGQNWIREAGGTWRKENHVLRFYHIDEEGNIQELVSHKRDQASLNKSFPFWVDSTKTVITTNHIPKHISCTTIAAALLCFWSSVCHAEIRFKRFGFAEIHQGNISIPVLHHRITEHNFHILEPSHVVVDLADFVIVQRDVGDDMRGRLSLLRLKWDAGVAYRCGLFHIMEEEWEMLDTVWRPIVLG